MTTKPAVWMLLLVASASATIRAQDDDTTLRVFLFAGQSNMVGSDSRVKDIAEFPPFVGLEEPQQKVRFSYCIGREEKHQSEGWTTLQPVDGVVGPELSFARRVTSEIKAPIAIIKCAAGGTHLGGDWNPDEPSGFKMYPLALKWVRSALADLDRKKIRYRIEGFLWHQGENDMHVASIITGIREDLGRPRLPWFVSHESPISSESGKDFDVSAALDKLTSEDKDFIHLKLNDLPGREKKLVLATAGVVAVGEALAEAYLKRSTNRR